MPKVGQSCSRTFALSATAMNDVSESILFGQFGCPGLAMPPGPEQPKVGPIRVTGAWGLSLGVRLGHSRGLQIA